MSSYSVAFYTEAGTKRGMGHLLRCYTIYEEFKQNNHHTFFHLDSDISFDYKFNDIKYFKYKDLDFSKKLDLIFIDSYEASIEVYQKLAKNCKLIVCIDDYARLSYPQGVIINFAPQSQELFSKTHSVNHTYLLGLSYVPIRKQFLQVQTPKKDKQLFIMLGGGDIGANLSIDILETQ